MKSSLLAVLILASSARAARVEKLPAATRTTTAVEFTAPAAPELRVTAAPGAPGLQAAGPAPLAAEVLAARPTAAAPRVEPVAAAPASPVAPGAAVAVARGARGFAAPAPARGEAAPSASKLKALKAASASDGPAFWDGTRKTLREADLGEAPGGDAGAPAGQAAPRAGRARPLEDGSSPGGSIDALEPPAAAAWSMSRIKRFFQEVLFEDAATAKDGRPLSAAAKQDAASSRADDLLAWIAAVNPANPKPAAAARHQLRFELPEIEVRLRAVKQLQGRIQQAEARGGDATALRAELAQVHAGLAEPLAQARAALMGWLPGELSAAPRAGGTRVFVDANLAIGMLDFLFAGEVKVKDLIMATEFAHALQGGRMVRMGAINYAEFVERVDSLRAKAPPEKRAAVERVTQMLLDAIDAKPLPPRAPRAAEAIMDERFQVRAPDPGDAITLAARALAVRNLSLASPLIRAGVGRDGHNAASPLFFKDVAGLMEAAERGGVYKTSDAGIYSRLEEVALNKKTVSGLHAAVREDGLIQVDIGTYDRGSYRFFVQPVRTAGYDGFALKK